MVDILELSAGRIRMRDTDGDVVFDTDERLFTVTDRLTGSVTLSSYTAQNRNLIDLSLINVDTLHALQSCNASADTVRGAFSVTTSGGTQGGLVGLGSFNASGTYVHYMDAISASGTSTKSFVRQVAAYTFVAVGGQLYIHERVFLGADYNAAAPAVTYSVTLLAPTFNYNLFVGTWV